MAHFVNYFSAAFFICYMLAAFVWPSIRTYRQTGINPVTFGKADNAHDYIGRAFKVTIALVPLAITTYFVDDKSLQYAHRFYYLQHHSMQITGTLLCIASFFWTVIAQWQMGNSWRIGIDENHKTELITNGLFKISRNPIFLGMIVTLIGVFLLMPDVITLTALIVGYLLIQIQVRLEEEFLINRYPTAYKVYSGKVSRFIGAR